LETSSGPPKQPMDRAGPQGQQQHTTSWFVEAIHRARSFGGDTTVLADYALTTTSYSKNLYSATYSTGQYIKQPPVYSPVIHGSDNGVTSIFIQAHSHPLPNQPQATVELMTVCCKSWKAFLTKYICFPMLTAIDNRPIPCVTEVQHGSACKLTPLYVMLFQRRPQKHA